MNEFELIKKYFTKQSTKRTDVNVGIGDDCAIVTPTNNQQLAITTDTLISNIHFFCNDPADSIGHKALAVNLSDLAAIGATPAWVTLALTLPNADETWLQGFCHGFFNLAGQHHVELIGGDLTHGHLSITIAAYGFLPVGKSLLRSTAKPGDLIYVSGNIGEAGLALQHLQNKLHVPTQYQESCLNKLQRPLPRLELSKKLLNLANTAIDISDGLAADLSHILEESNVGATVNIDYLPISPALTQVLSKEQAINLALNAGDDYELCFTISPEKKMELEKSCASLDYPITCIGEIQATPGLKLYDSNGKSFKGAIHGYQHF